MKRGLQWRRKIAPATRLNADSSRGRCQPLSKPAQKIRALAHEAPVARLHAVDEADKLRHDQREQGERQHRNEKLGQIDAAGDRSPALQHSESRDRFLEQRSALLFRHTLSTAAVDRLP
ncbi:MAG: hypothetical protein WCA22_11920, partial [Candidatus Binatus sp.]